MQLFNTLTKNKEDIKPINKGKINMFVCGPTVYDFIHAGNARTFTIFDTLSKYLRYVGYDVLYLQNITDIDDKIIQRALNDGSTPSKIAGIFEQEFIKDMESLGADGVSLYAKASDHIGDIINQVQRLMDKGYAYSAPAMPGTEAGAINSDFSFDVYFDIEKYEKDFPSQYGTLSGQKSDDIEIGSRKEIEANKKNPRDFVLWKAQNYTYEPSWNSPWGKGRPGWHIEDTAISERFFGPQYDIHGGGQDLTFPHHEAEIAQQQAASGKVPFVNIWLHAGFLITKSEKMSKSLGNTFILRDLLNEYGRSALRMYFLSAHYRSPLDFSRESIEQSRNGTKRISAFITLLKSASGSNNPSVDTLKNELISEFSTALDDDFNTPAGIASIFKFIRNVNSLINGKALSSVQAKELLDTFITIITILGIHPDTTEEIPSEVISLIEQRDTLRSAKNWEEADTLREKVESLGYRIEDTQYGPVANKI